MNIREDKICRILSSAVLVIVLLQPVNIDGKRTRLSLKASKTERTEARPWEEELNCETDSLRFEMLCEDIVFTGYDKPLTSARETWIVQNNTDAAIRSMRVEITYLTPEGKLLHKREADVKSAVPAGETRMVEVKSFDSQKSFYYYKSQAPRRSATPYMVKIRIVSIVIDRD